jgi:hypothetical protein
MNKPRLRYGVGTLLILITSVCVGLVAIISWVENAEAMVGLQTIQGPLTSGSPPQKIDPPSDDMVLLALRKALAKRRGFVTREFPKGSTNIRIVRQQTAEHVEPARVYPIVGPAQQYHTHYRYTIYYDLKRGDRHLKMEEHRYVLDVDYYHLHVLPSQPNQVAGTALHLPNP